jgi:hypothetical protein
LILTATARVDILDAFLLARRIESGGPLDAGWDINGDGRIDGDDVDAIAFAAVRLGPGPVACVPRTIQPHGMLGSVASLLQSSSILPFHDSEGRCVIRTLPQGAPPMRGRALDEGV